MTDDLTKFTLGAWASKNLPGRLDVATTAKVLGFAEHDIQILMASGKLVPLGDPAPNAPKWFASVEIIRLATDPDWLHKATKELSKYWMQKRLRSKAPLPRIHAVEEGEQTNRARMVMDDKAALEFRHHSPRL